MHDVELAVLLHALTDGPLRIPADLAENATIRKLIARQVIEEIEDEGYGPAVRVFQITGFGRSYLDPFPGLDG